MLRTVARELGLRPEARKHVLRTVARELGLRPEARKHALRAVAFTLKRLISFTLKLCGGPSPRAGTFRCFAKL